ncbi:transketolase [candidate division KSB3 bacterium]|uniref:Transketolase n=1 Tax=candidate division KSB3 bacterium TaxID=2044937 RepID=A0A2G6E190_9BACT|nr:MAG: transketolase [candidate division KSB3 bacterium]PIE28484.1 MAG: transketolase [candidate division KSB3 bacterium]
MQYQAQYLRLKVLDILHDKGTGHWGGASSAAEILTTLYYHVMNIDPEQPDWPERDRFVLSKGHASAMLYSVLAHCGYFAVEELDSFRQLNSRLQGHPCMNKTPGIEMSTGALGHGLSVSLGMALAARIQKKPFWSYVMMGEGCLNEGQTWEALMAAAKFQAERLVALIDLNGVQLDGPSDEIMPLKPLEDKFRAFQWNVAPKTYDGHSIADILASFDWTAQQSRWPVVVIYTTHKGKGVSFMEDNHQWHGAPIGDDDYAKARPELMTTLKALEAQL